LKSEVLELKSRRDNINHVYEEKYNKEEDSPDRKIAQIKKALKQFLSAHVNVLPDPTNDDNTKLFNIIQHLFTIENEKEIYKSKKGNPNILEEFFEKPFES
jgi:hypothetical protein